MGLNLDRNLGPRVPVHQPGGPTPATGLPHAGRPREARSGVHLRKLQPRAGRASGRADSAYVPRSKTFCGQPYDIGARSASHHREDRWMVLEHDGEDGFTLWSLRSRRDAERR